MAIEAGVDGRVIEVYPNMLYKVEIDGKEYICYISGKMRKNKINVLLGDKVEVVLDPYGGHGTNRIVRRK